MGFRALYNAKLMHANPTIPTTAATTGIFMIYNATQFTNNTAPTTPARLCCVVFVGGLSFSSVVKHSSISAGFGSCSLVSLSTEVGSTVFSICASSLLSFIG
ncbi:hypothetical protein [Wolbachia endosymbiont (group A) of Lypha dubia]|uniref:hypothetical protein n=1 Tax=Wolbachia endosymbiont (group A) of Lypha dubia TaxID=3066146 RepID=UPI00333E3775